jgi:hypothetical protein
VPPADPQKTHGVRIADFPIFPEISYNKNDSDDESYNSLDLGGAEGKPPVSLKQT